MARGRLLCAWHYRIERNRLHKRYFRTAWAWALDQFRCVVHLKICFQRLRNQASQLISPNSFRMPPGYLVCFYRDAVNITKSIKRILPYILGVPPYLLVSQTTYRPFTDLQAFQVKSDKSSRAFVKEGASRDAT